MRVMAGGGKHGCAPGAYLYYEIDWEDGSSTTTRGHTLTTVVGSEHLNGTKAQKKKAQENLRPDLFEVITALAVLMQPVEAACIRLDEKRFKGMKI